MIQTLISEVHQLREENVKLFQELSRHHQVLYNFINLVNNNLISKNLKYYTKRSASVSTAEFIIKNANNAKLFDDKASNLKYALSQVELDGLYLEFGVFKGTTINLISSEKKDKIIYGFDSFEGLPEDWTAREPKGTFDVEGNFPQVNKNVRLIKGWFNNTLPNFVEEHSENCAFIHVDSDLYSSAKTVFSFLKDRIISGTVIVFDEYIYTFA